MNMNMTTTSAETTHGIRYLWHFVVRIGKVITGGFTQDPNIRAGSIMVGILLIVGLLAPLISPHNPYQQDLMQSLNPPSWKHPFGTDLYGRDVFSRVIYGAWIAIKICVIGVGIAFVAGNIAGALAGYYGGWIDTIIMRIVDSIMAFPFLVLVIAIMAIFGPGLGNLYFAIAVVSWCQYARIARSKYISEKEADYVMAAKSVGFPDKRIIFGHVMPNAIAPTVVYASLDCALVILLAASLSFIGVGAQPPVPEWGAQIAEGRQLLQVAWWVATFPALGIMYTVIGCSILGDGLRDRLVS
jgi:peptide/nickel transport system permease protein